LDERTLAKIMKSSKRTILEGSDIRKLEALMFAVKTAIPPKSKSDNTGMARLAIWIYKSVKNNLIDPEVDFKRIIKLALDASGPYSKNPNAVFMGMLKTHFAYLG